MKKINETELIVNDAWKKVKKSLSKTYQTNAPPIGFTMGFICGVKHVEKIVKGK